MLQRAVTNPCSTLSLTQRYKGDSNVRGNTNKNFSELVLSSGSLSAFYCVHLFQMLYAEGRDWLYIIMATIMLTYFK